MASLSDISRHAGVSIATVLARPQRVQRIRSPRRPATRVLNAAKELGYAPSALARALVTRSSRIIGVIVADIVDPYFAEIARGVEEVAVGLGYLTMVCSAEQGPEAEIGHLRQLREYHAAGIVFAGSGRIRDPDTPELADAVNEARERGAVVVALAQRDFEAPSIVFDNEAAVYDLTTYVRSLGHQDIVFVEGPQSLHTSAQRLAGLQPRGRRRPRARRLLLRGRRRRRRAPARAREPPERDRGRQRRGGDRRADAAARGRREGARAGLDRRHRRHAPGALRRA